MCLAINIYIVVQVGRGEKKKDEIHQIVCHSWWCKIKTVAAGGEGKGLFSCLSAERNVAALRMSRRKALGSRLSAIHTLTSRLNTAGWPHHYEALNGTTQITHLSALRLDSQHQKKKIHVDMGVIFLRFRYCAKKSPPKHLIFLRCRFLDCCEGE